MNRRSFLAATSGIALSALLSGCQGNSATDLRVAMLINSIPPQLIQEFQQRGEVSVNLQKSLRSLYGMLQRWQAIAEKASSTPRADWVSLADYWLAPAIRKGLVQPVEVSALSHWSELATVWPTLVQRDGSSGRPSSAGSFWAVPYRWSHLVLLYDPTRLTPQANSLTTWADLLRPELARRVILPDHPRLVLGLAQKAVGTSINGNDPAAVEGFTPFLDQLHQQVRVYDSEHYLETLIVGDATAVVAWSDDVLPLLRQYRHLAVAVPPEGTVLSAQLWVQPKGVNPQTPLAASWLDFCLETDFATQLAIFGQGTSPRLWGVDPEQLPEPLRRSPQLVLTPAIASQSEFLLPLDDQVEARYRDLWQRLRS